MLVSFLWLKGPHKSLEIFQEIYLSLERYFEILKDYLLKKYFRRYIYPTKYRNNFTYYMWYHGTTEPYFKI